MSSGRESIFEERKKLVKKVLERVKDTLDLSNKNYAIIQFPTRYKERSIDIVAIDEQGQNIVLRVKPTLSISRDEVDDLIKASLALNAVPLMVTEDESLFDNIVYEREGIYILNERTLENMCLRPSELIALYRKGDLYVTLDSKAFKRLKSLRSFSLGDIAYRTGISRRTLYEYEREGGMVSIDLAERLVEVLGEDVVKTISLKTIRKEFIKKVSRVESKDLSKLRREKIVSLISNKKVKAVFDLKRSAPDYIVRNEERRIDIIVDATSKRYTLKEMVKKVTESIKVSNLVGGVTNLIVNRDKGLTLIDELSTQISINKLDIIKINDK